MHKHPNKLIKPSKILEVVLLLLLGLSFSVEGNPLSVPTARITLISLELGHIRTITNKVNHEVVLTVPTRYFEAYSFECNASYPVEWNYIGDGAPTATADVGRHFKDFYDVNTYTYQSTLFLYNLEELQSGRYICRGSNPEQEQLQIFYDLFIPGTGNHTFLTTVEKEVFTPVIKPIAFIPCTVSNPTAVINLYKGNNMGTYQRIETNQSIIFNPKKGFRLKMHELPDPYGNYLCTTYDNKKRRKINLVPERLRSKYEASSPLKGKIPVHFSYDYELNRVLCCTGTAFVPKLQWAGCGSVLDCKIKSVCFEEDRCENKVATVGGDNSGNAPAKLGDPGPVPKGCAGWKLRDDANGDHGIFKCSSPGVSQYQPYLLNRGNIFLDFEKAPPSEAILSLVKTSDEVTYVGSEVEYHCNSTRFYFAYGIRWAFQRGNGDIEFVEESSVVKDRYFVTAHRRRTTLKILHRDIKAVICFVPIANSATEWRTVSLPILVREPFNIPLKPIGHGERPQEFLSNEIPYNSKSHLFEPHSTTRPNKDFYNYHTSDDLLGSNDNIAPDIVGSPSNPNPVSVMNSKPLHDSKPRDYLYASQHHNPINPVPSYPTPSPIPRIWDTVASASIAHHSPQKNQPTGYFNIHTNQFEHVGSENKEPKPYSSTQPTPTIKPTMNYEHDELSPNIPYSNTHNNNYNPWPRQKYPHENPIQFPIQPSHRVRDDYNYETSTSRPQHMGYQNDYRTGSHESHKNNPGVFSSVRTSPSPLIQPKIHYDNQEKGYSLRYPSMDLKTYSNNPIGLGSSHSPAKSDHMAKYPTASPTHSAPSHYYEDKGSYLTDSRSSFTKPVVFPSPEENYGLSYLDTFRSGSAESQRLRNRLKLTTPAPNYYNHNQNVTSHSQQSSGSWERPPPPQAYKNYDEYERERQYYNPREPQPSQRNVDSQSSVGADEQFYYQRYASESQEFPVEHGTGGLGPTAHSYSNDNFIRRSENLYGDSVPLVELG